MDSGILIDLALKKPITDATIENALSQICEDTHSSCDDGCPVFYINNFNIPNYEDNQPNCDCYRNGRKMLKFIRDNA
jgi:hypothetical protein